MIYKHPPADFNPVADVSGCFIEVGDKILYLQYQPAKFNSTWGIPAGKVEPSETLATAIARELEEETGICLPINTFINPKTVYVRYPDYDFIFHMFKHQFNTEPQVNIDEKEHQQFKWVTHEEALNLDLIRDGAACIHAAYPFDPLYWTNHLKDQASKAKSFKELLPVAMTILESIPQPAGYASGPISNGGKSDPAAIENNSVRFKQAIANLIDQNHSIFDLTQYTEHVIRIAGGEWKPEHNTWLLNDFYLPLFESGLIKTIYMIPGWKQSAGATWEHEQAKRLGIEILYLDENLKLSLWQPKDYKRMNNAKTFKDLSDQALAMMRRSPGTMSWVCGPITNGGQGSIETNLEIFSQIIQQLNKQGKNAFSQLPFATDLNRINGTLNQYNIGEKTDLLQGFYKPIFTSGLIDTVYFIPDWKSSAGARWEHDTLTKLGTNIVYLEPDFSIPEPKQKQPAKIG